jgi:polyadenylate-binding protein
MSTTNTATTTEIVKQQNPYQSASLYVGDLHPDTTETNLFETFNAVGPVASIRVCRDHFTRRSLRYAYVNFHNIVDAERALDTMNYTAIKGKPCRIMWSLRDPSIRKVGKGNVFIKNLDKTIDNKALYDTFSAFGNILSSKVVTDDNGVSRGHGFVHYETIESAQNAIQKVNNMLLQGKKVFVGEFKTRKEREQEGVPEHRFTNVFVKNLDLNVNEEKLQSLFAEKDENGQPKYGNITSIKIGRNENGASKGFGFVNFENPDDAKKAVEEMHNRIFESKQIFVGRHQKKAEHSRELKQKFEQFKQLRLNKWNGLNCYIKNLEDQFNDDVLREKFSVFGTITSVKVAVNESGTSKGFGFVCFQSPEHAANAINKMNGQVVITKPLYVALHEPKEVRRQKLAALYNQRSLQSSGVPPYGGMPPQIYAYSVPTYGPPRNMMNTRGGFNMNPQRSGGYQGRGGPPKTHLQANQKQMTNRGGRGRGGSAQNKAYSGPNARVPNPNPPTANSKDILNTSTLVNFTPEQQKQIVGEKLYPLVQQNVPLPIAKQANKITGMLLELELTDLLHLLQSPESLKQRIDEAIQVLREANNNEINVDNSNDIDNKIN